MSGANLGSTGTYSSSASRPRSESSGVFPPSELPATSEADFGATTSSGNIADVESSSSFSFQPQDAEGSTKKGKSTPREPPVIFDNSSSVNDFFFTFDLQSGNVWGLFFLLASFAVGAMGWHYIIVVVFAWCITVYCFRQTKRRHMNTIFNVQTAMHDPDVARRIMGPYLPGWLSFAQVEKCGWLQDLINNLWPHIALATKDSIVSSVDPLLEYYRPKMLLTSLTVGVCELGTIAPVIDGIQTHRSENDTLIDIYFHWNGNPDIRVVAKALGVEVEASICNLQFQSVIRLFLGPHCHSWPCFGCLSMCFVGKPVIDFNIKAAKIPLEAIPGLTNWLDGFIRYTLSWSLVYPKRLVFPMLKDMKNIKIQESTVDPIGRLTVRVLRAERIPEGLFQTRRTYVEGKRTNGDAKTAVTKRTKSVQGKNPIYNEDLVFTVYNAPNERIELTVYTDETKPPVIGNLLITDNVLGVYRVGVSGLLSQKMTMMGNRLVNPAKTSAQVGTISFETEFTPFVLQTELMEPDADNLDHTVANLEGLNHGSAKMPLSPKNGSERGRSMGTDSMDGGASNGNLGGGRDSLSRTTTRRSSSAARLRRAALSGKSIKGILIVNIISCANLMKIDVIGSADPYVKLRIGNCSEKTDHLLDTLNPTFNIQKQLEVEDVMRDKLEVEVHDWDKFKINKRLLGKIDIPIADIFEVGCTEASKTYMLEPKGTITLGLKLMINAT